MKKIKKAIKTPLGEITSDNVDAKNQVFAEINHNDDGKIKEAQRKLLRRLSKDDKIEAWTWSQYYKDLVGKEDE